MALDQVNLAQRFTLMATNCYQFALKRANNKIDGAYRPLRCTFFPNKNSRTPAKSKFVFVLYKHVSAYLMLLLVSLRAPQCNRNNCGVNTIAYCCQNSED